MSTDVNSRPLYEVIDLTKENFLCQINGIDVAFPYLQGAPGLGKTASLQKLSEGFTFQGERYECGIISTHFSLKPIEETGGIPQFSKITLTVDGESKEYLGTEWSFPDIMMQVYKLASEMSNNNQFVIWLLDDMHLCGATHLAMLYELFTERKLREYVLPKNVAMVLAGNTSNKAGSKTMFSAIVNRVFQCPVHAHFDKWESDFAIPAEVHSGVRAFLRNEIYQQFFHEEEQVDTAWGSPRSWTRFANFLQIKEKIAGEGKVSSSDILYIATGHCGKSAASEFVSFYKVYQKFDIPSILKNIDRYSLPDNRAERYALSFAATNYYINNFKKDEIVDGYAHLVIKMAHRASELTLAMMKEVINTERTLNKRSLYNKVALRIEKIDPKVINEILDEIVDI